MKPRRFVGACSGVAIAVLVLTYGYLQPGIHAPAINDWLIFIVCPPSIILMAAENGKWYLFVLADSLVVVVNALWYWFLFAVAGMLFTR